MKYLILVPDGAAGDKIESLGNKTALEVSDIPVINSLARRGEIGMVQTIPEGIAPGSDAANLSVMGYDPSIYLTGRSPLEAASIGIDMADTDVSYRVNIITLDGDSDYDNLIIKDHASGDISTDEAAELIEALKNELTTEEIQFYLGVSYRHCMIVKEGNTGYTLTPPHDVLGGKVGDNLPKGEGSEFITELMRKSYGILKDHPVNLKRIAEGKNPANSMWIWGEGKKPSLSLFKDKYGIDGAAISAVDLIKGIAICAGLGAPNIEGATGTLHTNYEGKAEKAIENYKAGLPFNYIHVEAPDECSHQGNLEEKIQSMNEIDSRVLSPVLQYLESTGEEFSILVVPDHRTPVALRTHTSDPVPYVVYRGKGKEALLDGNENNRFSEVSGECGNKFDSGYALADYFFGK